MVLTRERVTNSVGELAASIEAKRWMSMRWSTKWAPSWNGQQVDRERAKSAGTAVGGRASRIAEGAE